MADETGAGAAAENSAAKRVLSITSRRRTGITYPDRGGAYQCFDQVKVTGAMSRWSQSVAAFDRIPGS